MSNLENLLSIDCLVTEDNWHEKLDDVGSLCSSLIRHSLNGVSLNLEAEREIEISVTLTNDAEIRALNREHRSKDKFTNYDKSASLELVVMDRYTGEVLWRKDANFSVSALKKKRGKGHFRI